MGDKVSKGDLLLNLASTQEISTGKLIPKDTESIIKQAEAKMMEKKRRSSNFSKTSCRKKTINYSSN